MEQLGAGNRAKVVKLQGRKSPYNTVKNLPQLRSSNAVPCYSPIARSLGSQPMETRCTARGETG